ncbi:MAG: Clp protease N-terminal domain-containing protein [Hyphomicrobiaceae bacterium]
MAEDGGRVPMSSGLQATLLRAREYAAGQSEAQVLLEHLLLALSEDADAAHVLEACQVDLGRLRNDVAGYLGSLNDRVPPGTPGAPAISSALTQVLKYATLAAQQGRRSSIDGAIVLAALVGDGRSMAASFLKAQGLTFDAAIQALRQAAARANGASQSPDQEPNPARIQGHPTPSINPEVAATTARAEDILARARERLESRNQPRHEPQHEQPTPAAGPTAAPYAEAAEAIPPPAPQVAPTGLARGRDGGQTPAPIDPFTPARSADHQPPSASFSDEIAAEASASPFPHHADEREINRSTAPHSPPDVSDPPDEASAPLHGDEREPLDEIQEPEPEPTPAISPTASREPRFDRSEMAGAHHNASASDRRQPPFEIPPPEPQSVSAGWAPPPTRPAAPPQPGSRPLPPPPHGWSAPPLPPGQPPRPPGPLQARPGEGDVASAPSHWSRPFTSADPRSEPFATSSSGYASSALVPTQAGTSPGGAAGKRPAIDASQVTHSIPRRLRKGRPQVIEVWIDRPPIAGNGGSRSFALRSENVVARAIAVRLRPLSGKFIIDAASPETQWDQSGAAGADRFASEAAVWRFTVTPLQSGRGTLQLAIAARTLGADGVLAETQLPDEAHQLRVARGFGGLLRRIALGLIAALAGMVLIKLVEAEMGIDFYYFFKQLLRVQP